MAVPAAHAERDYLQGLYIGVGLGYTEMEPDIDGTGFSESDKNDIGWKLFAGLDLTERFSLEGYYADLGEANFSPTGSIAYKDYGVSGLYYFYKESEYREGLSAFAHIGTGQMSNESTIPYQRIHDRHLMLGAGFEYVLDQSLALRLETELYDTDVHMVSLNLVVRLGGKRREKVIEQPKPIPVVASEPEPIILDTDNDGVFDNQDQCPDSAEGIKVDVRGCELLDVIVLKGVVFANNSSDLIGESETILKGVRDTLIRYPELKIEIAGYTDSRGSKNYNQKLSQQRASAVRSYLIKQGLSEVNLTAVGYGMENPIADNKTSEGRSQNRRVELHMLNQEDDESAKEKALETAQEITPETEVPVEATSEE